MRKWPWLQCLRSLQLYSLCLQAHRYRKSQNHYLSGTLASASLSLIGNFIDLGWCDFSGKSPVDEEVFPESADAIVKKDLVSFSAYIL